MTSVKDFLLENNSSKIFAVEQRPCHWKFVGNAGFKLPSRQASNPSRWKAGSNIPNKSTSAIESSIEGSKSCMPIVGCTLRASECWLLSAVRWNEGPWWFGALPSLRGISLHADWCGCLFSYEETAVTTRSISFSSFLPISDVLEADQKTPFSSDNASQRVWNWARERARCRGSLLCRISRYAILIESEIAYGMKGNSMSWSCSSRVMLELSIEVERLWRRYVIDDLWWSTKLLVRHDNIATAW